MPLPSTICGIIGAILGVNRRDLKEFASKVDLHCGAELIKFDGYISEIARIFKFPKQKILDIVKKLKDPKKAKELQPLYKSIMLYRPQYKLAIALNDEDVYFKIIRRLKTLDFKYEIYGGNDYNFVENIWEIKEAKLITTNIGQGYCLGKDFNDVLIKDESMILSDIVLADIKDRLIFAYGAEICTKGKIKAVDDGESKIFVHQASKFLVSELFLGDEIGCKF